MKNWTKFEKTLLTANIILTAIAVIIGKTYGWLDVLGALSALTNVVCVILCARRSITNYYWGIPAVLSYGILSLIYGNLGEAGLNLTYYLFMQFYGIKQWNKNLESKNIVISKKMTRKQAITTYSLLVLCTVVFGVILMSASTPIQGLFYGSAAKGFGYDKFLIDSATTVFSVFAMYLMAKCYLEQWLIWIIIDVFTVILWTVYTPNTFMAIQWIVFTANACYGYYEWKSNETLHRRIENARQILP